MRSIRRGSRGLSEIVGTLMLVLIVVAAATALAAFVASYQKQLQSQQAETHARSLESLRVLSVHPAPKSGSTALAWLNFTLASLSVNPSSVTGILLGDAPLLDFGISGNLVEPLNLSPNAPFEFTLKALGHASISANLSKSPDVQLHLTEFVKIEILTTLQNRFLALFVPPTAVAQVSTIQSVSGGTPVTLPLLDGSRSFPSGNASLVSWSWSIAKVSGTGICPAGPYSGQQVVVPSSCSSPSPFTTYNATLTVTDSTGLLAISTVSFSD